ncbi:MAG: flagellar motor stator protein MotA [Gemmatimonadales bacterium]
MFLIIGLIVVFGSIVGGFVMHHGHVAVLVQINEFLIIGGGALGSMMVGNPPGTLKRAMTQSLALLKPDPFDQKAYGELLQLLYQILRTARKDGLTGLEPHIERPEESEIFKKFPSFMHHTAAVALLCDTLKVLLSGTVEDHHLADILDVDLEQQHHEAMAVSAAITKTGDAMPGFGIVAAVLGVIVTMGSIGGSASEIGEKVAAALVGTFLGILLSYGVMGPMAQAIEGRIGSEHAYMLCIRTALISFSRGDSPMSAVEFARRNIEPANRPSFSALEELTRGKAA